MKYRTLTTNIFTLLIVLATASIHAQDDAGDESVADAETVQNELLEAARAKGGDVLIMKSGAIIGGVQILKRSPLNYEVELVPGMKPMVIPRRRVIRVEYDDIDPTRERNRRRSAPKRDDELMADGKELAPEFAAKLNKPITGPVLDFDQRDYVEVFAELSKKTDVTIVIDRSLRSQPRPTRLWTIKITPEMTLMQILREQWAGKFKTGIVTFELNKVVLKQKGATTSGTSQPNALPVLKLGK